MSRSPVGVVRIWLNVQRKLADLASVRSLSRVRQATGSTVFSGDSVTRIAAGAAATRLGAGAPSRQARRLQTCPPSCGGSQRKLTPEVDSPQLENVARRRAGTP